MPKTIFLLLIVLLTVTGCEKEEVLKGTPKCIAKKINKIASEETANPPASVYRYQYKGKTVYYFPPRCCDIPSELYDGDCNFICSPDGGFTGRGDGKCPDFFTTRTDETLIWEDKR
jgi:hypothetical protein